MQKAADFVDLERFDSVFSALWIVTFVTVVLFPPISLSFSILDAFPLPLQKQL